MYVCWLINNSGTGGATIFKFSEITPGFPGVDSSAKMGDHVYRPENWDFPFVAKPAGHAADWALGNEHTDADGQCKDAIHAGVGADENGKWGPWAGEKRDGA